MDHPLQELMRKSDGFVVIGDSSEGRFPAQSFHCYTQAKKPFYCLDLGGMTESRGFTKGGKVYTSVDELPADHSDLAIVWMKPRSAIRGVETAHAGCKKIWSASKRPPRRGAAPAALDGGSRDRPCGYYPNSWGCVPRAHAAVKSADLGKPPQTIRREAARDVVIELHTSVSWCTENSWCSVSRELNAAGRPTGRRRRTRHET